VILDVLLWWVQGMWRWSVLGSSPAFSGISGTAIATGVAAATTIVATVATEATVATVAIVAIVAIAAARPALAKRGAATVE
jgi:hypothetical protein